MNRDLGNLNYDSVSNEEMLKGLIDARIPVMLHGKPGVGKTERVKDLDPTAEILSLPYKEPTQIMGKTIVNPTTGKVEDIAPTWYLRLVEKCKNEPNKTHILFLDEITNALPSIQAMAYQLVLDRVVNDLWELPENCAVVAAGNEVEDSLSAFDMPEPLHSRFAHLYIQTSAKDWVKWGVSKGIHPTILSFIAWKGDVALYTKHDGVNPNADPRKWARASDLLKHTNNIQYLRSLVGPELTVELEAFSQIEMPTIEEVVSGKAVMPKGVAAKFATIGAMSSANEEQVEKVWKFVSNMEREYQAIFTQMWASSGGEKNKINRFKTLLDLNGAKEVFQGLDR